MICIALQKKIGVAEKPVFSQAKILRAYKAYLAYAVLTNFARPVASRKFELMKKGKM